VPTKPFCLDGVDIEASYSTKECEVPGKFAIFERGAPEKNVGTSDMNELFVSINPGGPAVKFIALSFTKFPK